MKKSCLFFDKKFKCVSFIVHYKCLTLTLLSYTMPAYLPCHVLADPGMPQTLNVPFLLDWLAIYGITTFNNSTARTCTQKAYYTLTVNTYGMH